MRQETVASLAPPKRKFNDRTQPHIQCNGCNKYGHLVPECTQKEEPGYNDNATITWAESDYGKKAKAKGILYLGYIPRSSSSSDKHFHKK